MDLSQRTVSSSTFALPDGTWQTATAMSPVWVRTGGDGTSEDDWAALDAHLTAGKDGMLRPVAHPGDVQISGAQRAGADGVSVVASLTDPATGVRSDLTWPGDLPAPTVTGPRAVFADLEPGMDMVVDVTGAGVEQFFVLDQAPKDPAALDIPLGVAAQHTTADADGGVSFVKKAAKKTTVVAQVAAAQMWDATYDSQLAHPVTEAWDEAGDPALWGVDDPAVKASVEKTPAPKGSSPTAASDAVFDLGVVDPVPTEVAVDGDAADVTLSPGAGFLAGADTVYPVVIDPSVSLALPYDTYVQSDMTSDRSQETELRVGTFDGGTTKARSFMNVTLTPIHGQQITSASLKLWQYHSYSCTPRSWQVQDTGLVDKDTRWTHQPTWTSKVWATSSDTRGYSSACAGGWSTVDITSLAQAWADSSVTTNAIGVRATSETDSYGWKRFNSTNAASGKPTIVVNYNRPPATPSSATHAAGQYAWYPSSTASDRVLYVKTLNPKFNATVTDPDGGDVKALMDLSQGTTAVWNKVAGTSVASGGSSAIGAGGAALTNGKAYTGKVWASDGSLTSPASKAITGFTIDTSAPSTPSVTATGYTNGQWKDTKPSSNTFTLTSTSSDVVTFEYRLDAATTWTAVPATGTTPTASLAWNPTNGAHTLTVRAIDKAAWPSAQKTFSFGAGGAVLVSPVQGIKSTDSFAISANAPQAASGTVTASVYSRPAGTANDAAYDPVLGTTRGWDLDASTEASTTIAKDGAAWVKTEFSGAGAASALGKDRVPVTLDVQVCFTYTAPAVVRCTWNNSQTAKTPTVTRVPHAFGDSFPTADAGPGQVALWTGEFNTSATDVTVPGYVGDLSVSRSYSSLAGPDDASVFGKGWSASFDGTDTGIAGYEVVDNTDVDGTFALVDDEGGALIYRQPGNGHVLMKTGTYTAFDEDTKATGATLRLTGSGSAARLTFTEDDGTVTMFSPLSSAANTDREWVANSVSEPASSGATTFTRNSAGDVTRILSPAPPDVTCNAAGTLVAGCRALNITYTAGRVSSISYEAYDPTSAAMKATVVAAYTYTNGFLTRVTDPRSGRHSDYTYAGVSASGQPLLASVTPPGLKTISLRYGVGISAQDPASLIGVDQANLTSSGTTSLASFAYGLTPGAAGGGLPGLSAADVAVWGQDAAPTYGGAVFGPDHPVAGGPASSVTAADWPYADLQYTDDQGRVLNTAAFGADAWQLDATGYDDAGRIVRTLDQGAIAQIRAATAATGQLSDGAVNSYATLTRYNDEIKASASAVGPVVDGAATTVAKDAVIVEPGSLVTDTWAPAAPNADGLETRMHTHTDYDQQAPNQGVNPKTGLGFALATTTTTTESPAEVDPQGPAATGEPVLDESRTGYAPIDGADLLGATSGWILGSATTSTTVAASGNITTRTRYDGEGRVVESRQPTSNGADAGTTLSGYYTAAAQTGAFASCGLKPQWAGLACQTRTADSGATPVQTTTGYSYYLAPTTVTETKGSTVRTTATTYLADGATNTTATTVTGLASSTPAPMTKTEYDPATGLATATVSLNGATEVGRISTAYDAWGRAASYTDTDGQITTTTYDTAGRVAQVRDPKGVTKYSYDETINGVVEHRGLPTGVNLNGTQQFTATYDAAGNIVSQSMPGRITQTNAYDRGGQLAELSYTAADTAGAQVPVASWSITSTAEGKTASVSTNVGADDNGIGRALAYTYDEADRLTGVSDTLGGPENPDATCASRSYGFDLNGNRVSQATTTGTVVPSGECADTSTVSKAWSYDTADRVQSGATVTGGGSPGGGVYAYDALGRQTTVPAVDTPAGTNAGDLNISYYDTDAARSLTQAGTTTTYGLDAAGRRSTSTSVTGSATTTLTRHYGDSSDSPAWALEDNGDQITTTWYGTSVAGDLGITTTTAGSDSPVSRVTLVDPHGEVALTMPADTLTAPAVLGANWYDEYGKALTATTDTDAITYGAFGAKERAQDTTGLTLMGMRLYNPVSGSFTSIDPVTGGNTTAYTYPQDPINHADPSGNFFVIDDAIVAALAVIAAIGLSIYFMWWWKTHCKYGCSVAVRASHIPFPNVKAWSAKRYSQSTYYVYEIYRERDGATWKYGISRVGMSRAYSQVPNCGRKFGGSCDAKRRLKVTGWFAARMGEAGLIYAYAARHGHCPPGQYYSCI
ncbi:DNRLRE domain-containing protein [Cellulomonas sp. PhB143]|uniref:DNRLRE domain-containing protein n=1 Tax=Cellulomonas sp. PhB143 TaxID=2485186 RepID=UPI000F494003|nr:DNRLRE domain-containing protein [Cellulomonas sp. PhB143]